MKMNEDKMKVECESLTKKMNKMKSQIASLNAHIYDQQLLSRKDETIRKSGQCIRDMKYEIREKCRKHQFGTDQKKKGVYNRRNIEKTLCP
jgi:SMC interacting uncharacterized protein involved in chromosome segregation